MDLKERKLWCVSLITLALFSILPAFRAQLFGTDYNTYYALRAGLFLLLILFFRSISDSFNRDLSIGDTSPVITGYGDPLLTLRAFACAIVLIGHGASIHFAPADLGHQAAQSRAFWLLLPLPMAGVFIFFTLSGYLMGKCFFTGRYSFTKEGVVRFYRNRFLRLAPLAYFTIAVIVLLQRPDALLAANIKHLVALLMFDYDGTSPLSLLGLLSSISTEMQFYLVAPYMALGIFLLAARYSIFWLIAGILAAGTAYRLGFMYFSDERWITSVYVPLLGNLDLFGIGMATSYLVQTRPIKAARLSYAVFCLAAIWLACTLLWSKYIVSTETVRLFLYYGAPPLFGLATAALIITMENAARYASRARSWANLLIKKTQIFGVLTYAVYLWHTPIFAAYAGVMNKPVTSRATLQALLIGTTLVLAFSWVMHLLIERPIEDFKKT